MLTYHPAGRLGTWTISIWDGTNVDSTVMWMKTTDNKEEGMHQLLKRFAKDMQSGVGTIAHGQTKGRPIPVIWEWEHNWVKTNLTYHASLERSELLKAPSD